jgi:hypothetical protein
MASSDEPPTSDSTSETRRSGPTRSRRAAVKWAADRLRATAARKLAWFGGGFYAIGAGITLLLYEARSLWHSRWFSAATWHALWADLSAGWEPAGRALAHLVEEMVRGALVGMMDGFVVAVQWPVYVLGAVGPVGLALVMGLGAGLYGVARWAFPSVRSFAEAIERAGDDRRTPPG